MSAQIDHLVIGAHTLEQGAQWCEQVLGVIPAPGGRHVHMGTHNRLLAIASAAFPQAYLEIIAIDPDAPPPSRMRWFGLDEPATQARLRERPRLLHLVARTRRLDATLAALAEQGIDAGQAVAAERASPNGLYRWRIAGRADGRLPFGGALPTLIEWSGMHPTDHLPHSGVALQSLTLGGLPDAAARALALQVVAHRPGAALRARLDTPRGPVELCSDD